MGVASTTNDDQLSTFSNYGPQLVWVAAPGEGVVTTYPFSTYAASWGTSFSTPFVSGLAAAMRSVNPLMNQSQSSGGGCACTSRSIRMQDMAGWTCCGPCRPRCPTGFPSESAAKPRMGEPLLAVHDLTVKYDSSSVPAVNGATFSLAPGECLGIFGKSGSGKTTLARSLLALRARHCRVTAGSIRFRGHEILGLRESKLREIRGRDLALIGQEPELALNPVSDGRATN